MTFLANINKSVKTRINDPLWGEPPVECPSQRTNNVETIKLWHHHAHTCTHTHSHTPLWCVKVTLKLFGRMKIIWYYAPTFKSALTGRCPRDRPTNRPTARSPNRFDPGQALNELPKNWRVDISWPLSELNRFWSQSRMRQTLGWQLGNDWKK